MRSDAVHWRRLMICQLLSSSPLCLEIFKGIIRRHGSGIERPKRRCYHPITSCGMRGQVRCFPPLTAWPIDGGDGAKLRDRREQQRIIIPKVDSLIGNQPERGCFCCCWWWCTVPIYARIRPFSICEFDFASLSLSQVDD